MNLEKLRDEQLFFPNRCNGKEEFAMPKQKDFFVNHTKTKKIKF